MQNRIEPQSSTETAPTFTKPCAPTASEADPLPFYSACARSWPLYRLSHPSLSNRHPDQILSQTRHLIERSLVNLRIARCRFSLFRPFCQDQRRVAPCGPWQGRGTARKPAFYRAPCVCRSRAETAETRLWPSWGGARAVPAPILPVWCRSHVLPCVRPSWPVLCRVPCRLCAAILPYFPLAFLLPQSRARDN